MNGIKAPALARYVQAGAAIVIRSLASLVSNKLIAMTFGPPGVALLAHFTNLLAVIMALPNDGSNRGLVKYGAIVPPQSAAYGRLVGAGLAYIALTSALTGLLFLALKDSVLQTFAGGGFTAGSFGFYYWATVPLYLVFLMALALLLARQDQPMHLLCMSVGSVTNVAAVGACIYYGASLQVVLLAWLAAQLPGLLVALAVHLRKGYLPLNRLQWPDRRALRQLGSFVALATVVAVFGRSSDLIVRQYALDQLGAVDTGLWQGIVKLSDAYITPVNNLIATVFFPAMSLLAPQPVAARSYMQRTLLVVLPATLLLLGGIWWWAPELLVLVHSREFAVVAPLYKWQALTDLARILAYFLATVLMVQVRIKLLTWLEAGSALVYLALVFSRDASAEWLLQANAIRYGFYLLALLVINKGLWGGRKV